MRASRALALAHRFGGSLGVERGEDSCRDETRPRWGQRDVFERGRRQEDPRGKRNSGQMRLEEVG